MAAERPKDVVRAWVEAFNAHDPDALAAMYRPDAVNHQVAEEPVVGREAIRRMFRDGFATAHMVCIPENLFEDGAWAILEWRDPLGLRGCGFFHVIDGRCFLTVGTGRRPALSGRGVCMPALPGRRARAAPYHHGPSPNLSACPGAP